MFEIKTLKEVSSIQFVLSQHVTTFFVAPVHLQKNQHISQFCIPSVVVMFNEFPKKQRATFSAKTLLDANVPVVFASGSQWERYGNPWLLGNPWLRGITPGNPWKPTMFFTNPGGNRSCSLRIQIPP